MSEEDVEPPEFVEGDKAEELVSAAVDADGFDAVRDAIREELEASGWVDEAVLTTPDAYDVNADDAAVHPPTEVPDDDMPGSRCPDGTDYMVGLRPFSSDEVMTDIFVALSEDHQPQHVHCSIEYQDIDGRIGSVDMYQYDPQEGVVEEPTEIPDDLVDWRDDAWEDAASAAAEARGFDVLYAITAEAGEVERWWEGLTLLGRMLTGGVMDREGGPEARAVLHSPGRAVPYGEDEPPTYQVKFDVPADEATGAFLGVELSDEYDLRRMRGRAVYLGDDDDEGRILEAGYDVEDGDRWLDEVPLEEHDHGGMFL